MRARKVGVVGAGTMGAGIALVTSAAGMQVALNDIQPQQLEAARAHIEGIYRRRAERGTLSAQEMQQRLSLVDYSLAYDSLADADIVIEAVPEEIGLKKRVFARLDQVCRPDTILATNTSALSVAELAAASGRPQQVIGMHFFNPVQAMKLVEVIPGPRTEAKVVEMVTGLARELGKVPVVVRDRPGFLVNRLLMPYLNEAAMCLQEEAATTQEIDAAMGRSGFGWPMGPLALMDMLGLDVCHHIAAYLAVQYGERMPEAALLRALYDDGRYGQKSGRGFYDHAGAMCPADVSALIHALHKGGAGRSGSPFSVDRVMAPLLNEAFRCVEEEVARVEDVDLACITGLGMQVRRGSQLVPCGPLEYADDRGLDTVLDTLRDLHTALGGRFRPAAILEHKVRAGVLGKKSGRGFRMYGS